MPLLSDDDGCLRCRAVLNPCGRRGDMAHCPHQLNMSRRLANPVSRKRTLTYEAASGLAPYLYVSDVVVKSVAARRQPIMESPGGGIGQP